MPTINHETTVKDWKTISGCGSSAAFAQYASCLHESNLS